MTDETVPADPESGRSAVVGPWRGSTLTPDADADERGRYFEVVTRIAELIELAVGERDAVLDMQAVLVIEGGGAPRHGIRYWKVHYLRDLGRHSGYAGTPHPNGGAWVHHESATMCPTLTAVVLSIAASHAYEFDLETNSRRLRTEFLR